MATFLERIERRLEAPGGLLRASLLISLIHVAFAAIWPQQDIISDAGAFHRLAIGLMERGEFGTKGYPEIGFMPIYPALLAFIYKLFGIHPTVALLLQSALVGPIAAMVHRLASKLFDGRTAALAMLVVGFLPALFGYGSVLLAELLVITLVSLYLNLVIPPREQALTLGRAALAGLALGVLCLTKPEYCLWGLAIGLLARLRGAPWPRVAAVLAVGGVCAIAVIAPWSIRNTTIFHHFVPFSASAGHTFWPSAHKPDFVDMDHPAFKEAEQRCLAQTGDDKVLFESCLMQDAKRMVGEHPGYYALTVVKRAVRMFVGSQTESVKHLSMGFSQAIHERHLLILVTKVALFALNTSFHLIGLIGLFWLCRQGDRWVLVYAASTKIAIHALIMSVPRYGLQLAPVLAVTAAACLLALWARRPASRSRPSSPALSQG